MRISWSCQVSSFCGALFRPSGKMLNDVHISTGDIYITDTFFYSRQKYMVKYPDFVSVGKKYRIQAGLLSVISIKDKIKLAWIWSKPNITASLRKIFQPYCGRSKFTFSKGKSV